MQKNTTNHDFINLWCIGTGSAFCLGGNGHSLFCLSGPTVATSLPSLFCRVLPLRPPFPLCLVASYRCDIRSLFVFSDRERLFTCVVCPSWSNGINWITTGIQLWAFPERAVPKWPRNVIYNFIFVSAVLCSLLAIFCVYVCECLLLVCGLPRTAKPCSPA